MSFGIGGDPSKLFSKSPDESKTNSSVNSTIEIHPLTMNPTEAWAKLSKTNKVEKLTPMSPDIPINPDKVRFVCLSDTHSLTSRMTHPVPDGDILIHAGDFSNTGLITEVEDFNKFLGSLPHLYKVIIAGNHELTFDPLTSGRIGNFKSRMEKDKDFSNRDQVSESKFDHPRELLTNCIYLEDSTVEIYGLKIYGSPWQPEFFDWAFNLTRGADCLAKWDMIPSDTDILITHGPPIGHGDRCQSKRAGCVELLSTIQNRVKPKVHVFGHIHEDYGVTSNGTTMFINASICTRQYHPTNPPIVFDIPLPPRVFKSQS